MKEVKSPKKPLIYYYSIILLIVLLFNLIVSPLLMKNQELAMQVSLLNQENERIIKELERLTGKQARDL